MKFTNKSSKTLITTISIATVAVLILTGTFAWNTIQTAITAGRGINFHYLVNLMNENYEGTYQYNDWRVGQPLDKPVYATSSYANETIKENYDRIVLEETKDGGEEPMFSDTWVRIKITERFEHNGVTRIETVKKLETGKLVSSFTEENNGYFQLLQNDESSTIIYTLDEWYNRLTTEQTFEVNGMFWILDEATGWLYWGQPVLAPTSQGDPVIGQETDHIIDMVELTKQPSGIWDYQITANLEAFDAELIGYEEEGAWSDVSDIHRIHQLFGRVNADGDVYVNVTNFPDAGFRQYLLNDSLDTHGDDYEKERALDKKLTSEEINATTIIELAATPRGIRDLTGIEYFTELRVLRAQANDAHINNPNRIILTHIDVSKLVNLTDLRLYNNQLTSLDVSKLVNLTALRVNNNQLTSLDLSKNVNLTNLNISNNQLTHVDVSNNVNLNTFYLEKNRLTKLNITMLDGLTAFNANDNNLTTLTLGNHPLVSTQFIISGNRLSSLDISGLPVEYQKAEETIDKFVINQQYKVDGEKTVGNQRQNATYDDETKTLTWEE